MNKKSASALSPSYLFKLKEICMNASTNNSVPCITRGNTTDIYTDKGVPTL